MKILMHICCAPCAIYPLRILREEGAEVSGFFFNPNIHPYGEYKKRSDTLKEYSSKCGLKMIFDEAYPMEEFLRNVAFREQERCRYCYYTRLSRAVEAARDGRFDGFTTTLLYSKYQKHDLIREMADSLAKDAGVEFVYFDFRKGWKEGIEASKAMGLYRQRYCGCIYSEKERNFKSRA